jgi:molybdate transport system substrate-binding protein
MIRAALALFLLVSSSAARADEVVLYGAGSLRAALGAIASDYSSKSGHVVRTQFGPSGVMRDKIEAGDNVDLFASADMGNALKLRTDGKAVAVVMFVRNDLCAFAKPNVGLSSANFGEKLLDPAVKLGTSTPKADPGGDYTWAMFHLIDKTKPGAFQALDAKAQKIVGASATVDPANPNPIQTAFKSGKINVMIGYCSGAAQQKADVPDVETVTIPEKYATGPEYGLAITSFEKPAALGLAMAILSPEGQATFAKFGFVPIGLPAAK